ncbi:LADA_0F09648g1_1 [Lachancea dasiensis]|uniref:LADA_0F09648g1_1 n=1 Tax=Lachancea dasiensis TaxID=1072105 RepID=A0A1G4JLS6_9SACH|nr:LADA_0F09648g1_1 [Lachancea dasiensis]
MTESDVSTDCSSPKRYAEEYTDQQILKWAGKLELESVDLRDKSEKLIHLLEGNSKVLKTSFEKLNEVTGGLKDLKEVHEKLQQMKSAVQKAGKEQSSRTAGVKKLEKQIEGVLQGFSKSYSLDVVRAQKEIIGSFGKLEAKFEERLEEFTSVGTSTLTKALAESAGVFKDMESRLDAKMGSFAESHSAHFEKAVKEVHNELVNLVRQSAGLTQVLSSMSTETMRVSQRQLHLEQQVCSLKADIANLRGNCINRKEIISSNAHDSKVTKPVSPTCSKEQTRHRRAQTTLATRWIIPWDEISDSETLLSSEL